MTGGHSMLCGNMAESVTWAREKALNSSLCGSPIPAGSPESSLRTETSRLMASYKDPTSHHRIMNSFSRLVNF